MNIKFATVTIVNSDGFYIKFNGEQIESQRVYKKLATYNPVLNDKIAVLYDGSNYLVLGKVN